MLYGEANLWEIPKRIRMCSSKSYESVVEDERWKHHHYMNLKNDYHPSPVAFEIFACKSSGTDICRCINYENEKRNLLGTY